MKKILIISAVMAIAAFAYSKYQLSGTVDNNLKGISTYYEMQEALSGYPVLTIEDLYVDAPDSDSVVQSLLEQKETIIDKLSADSMLVHGEYNVFEVTVNDYFKLYPDSYVQKANVTKVIVGNNEMTGKEIVLSQIYGLYDTEDGTFVIGTRGRNFLKPGYSYLVFCEKCEISDYLDTPSYRTLINQFSTVCLSEEAMVAPNGAEYSDFTGCEFLIREQNVADAVENVKEYIVSNYQHDMDL